MLQYILATTIFFFIVFFVYIKIKYPFWNNQPVFHTYDYWRYFYSTPFIIHRYRPVKTKFCDFTSVVTKNLSEYTDENIGELTNLLQCYYVSSDRILHTISAQNIKTILSGIGEPFYNYDNVKTAVEILKDKDGLNYGPKKITVSTAGIADKIPLAAKEIGTYLALSLHAPTDEIRELIMPINKKFKIKDLIEQCKYYAETVNEKITLEYVMLRGINDSKECANQLTKIMAQFPCKVNLIEFNPWPGVNYLPTERQDMESFSKIIQDAGYVSTIRRSRGQDILGACGQLRTESERKKLN